MSRLTLAVVVLGVAAAAATAHEIKVLASQQAVAEAGGKCTVYLSWGHRVPVDDLIDAATLERYDLLPPAGDPTPLKAADTSLQANSVPLKAAGVYQAVAVRKPSVITYVIDKEGERVMKRGGKSAATGGTVDSALRSVQAGKAIIVVGPAGEEAVKPAGLPVEIVPLDPPAKWKANADLKFQVLVNGKAVTTAPMVEARVIGFKPDNAWGYSTHADKTGTATVCPDKAGTWVLKVNVKVPAAEADRKEFDQESFTATLTLEVAP